MINVREVLRRLVKYLVLVLVIAFVCYKLLGDKVSNFEVIIIALSGGFVYNLLDLVTPSINLKIDKTYGV